MALQDTTVVLRALADGRWTDFYRLWVDRTRHFDNPRPQVRLDIRQVSRSDDVLVVLEAEVLQSDGTEPSWIVSVLTRGDRYAIEGSVVTETPEGEPTVL